MSACESVGTVDFRRSLPPRLPSLHLQMVGALGSLMTRCDLGVLNHQSISRGTEADRAAGAHLLQPRFGLLDPQRVIVTNGTQNALLILLRELVGVNGLLLAERLSYAALPALARCASVQVEGIALDADGVIPEAFEAACRARQPKALYCNPTVQNPTTAVMPETRRREIAEIARRHGVWLIEDEALGRLHPEAPKPIAALAPDVTWYVMSATKCLSHGLRLAWLVAPAPEVADGLLREVGHLSFWHPAPILAALATQWVGSGTADQISLGIAQECRAREAAARAILAGHRLHSQPGSMHIWVDVPARWSTREFVERAHSRGVLVRPAEVFAVDDRPGPNAVRASLSTPANIHEVRCGLERLRAVLEGESA